MDKDRRQFLRIQVPEEADALDAQGKRLGRVLEAGGGGMSIRLDGSAAAPAVGSRMTITVVESGTNQVIHTASVVVRSCQNQSLGLEFVSESGEPASP